VTRRYVESSPEISRSLTARARAEAGFFRWGCSKSEMGRLGHHTKEQKFEVAYTTPSPKKTVLRRITLGLGPTTLFL
jgi:hypothetical protein